MMTVKATDNGFLDNLYRFREDVFEIKEEQFTTVWMTEDLSWRPPVITGPYVPWGIPTPR